MRNPAHISRIFTPHVSRDEFFMMTGSLNVLSMNYSVYWRPRDRVAVSLPYFNSRLTIGRHELRSEHSRYACVMVLTFSPRSLIHYLGGRRETLTRTPLSPPRDIKHAVLADKSKSARVQSPHRLQHLVIRFFVSLSWIKGST